MSSELIPLIQKWRRQVPPGARHDAASEAQVKAFESEWGPIPAQYRTFLLLGGGGAVGSDWLDGIAQLHTFHIRYLRECGKSDWAARMLLIGWDGSGAPIGLDGDGAVIVEYEEGAIAHVAPSFGAYLQDALTRMRR